MVGLHATHAGHDAAVRGSALEQQGLFQPDRTARGVRTMTAQRTHLSLGEKEKQAAIRLQQGKGMVQGLDRTEALEQDQVIAGAAMGCGGVGRTGVHAEVAAAEDGDRPGEQPAAPGIRLECIDLELGTSNGRCDLGQPEPSTLDPYTRGNGFDDRRGRGCRGGLFVSGRCGFGGDEPFHLAGLEEGCETRDRLDVLTDRGGDRHPTGPSEEPVVEDPHTVHGRLVGQTSGELDPSGLLTQVGSEAGADESLDCFGPDEFDHARSSVSGPGPAARRWCRVAQGMGWVGCGSVGHRAGTDKSGPLSPCRHLLSVGSMSTPPAPRVLLFDLDGTLVDSIDDLTASANHTRASYGLPPLDRQTVRSYVGDGARKLLERTFGDAAPSIDLDEALHRFREHYLQHCLEQTRPYPGVLESLRALRPIPRALVSNKPQPMCDRIVEGLGLSTELEAVVGARPGVPVKPDPASLRIALAAVGADRPVDASVWMVGDSPNDLLAARALGATAVAVAWGLTPVPRLREFGPDLLLERIDDLVDFVRR